MKDTPPDIEERFRQMLMRLSPGERLAMACRMFDTAKTLALATMAPEDVDTPAKMRCQLFLRFYGEDFDESERAKILAHLAAT